VLGAAGGIGQPLSLLLKLNPRVTELALYDIRGGPGTYFSFETEALDM
jgi:malate dehydrogenase